MYLHYYCVLLLLKYTVLQPNMSPIKWLNNLLIMENIIGIYRNYVTQKKIKKYFFAFHILIYTIFNTLISISEVYLLLTRDQSNQIDHIYCALIISCYISCFVSVMTGICYSRTFISFFDSVSRISERFEDDKKLMNSLKKLHWFSITFILFCITFAVHRSIDLVFNYEKIEYATYVLVRVPIFLSQALMRTTLLFEKFLFFVVIMIVVLLCKCSTSLISAVQEKVETFDIGSDEQCFITKEQIQEWVELYRDLTNNCGKITLCFGRQFTCSLMASVFYYILLTYQMCYLSVLNIQDEKIAIVIVSYILLMIFPIVAGQMILNQGVKYHRILARIYNKMIIIDSKEAEARLVKDFIRLIKKDPLKIELLSNIPAGTYFLPVILMSTVNYIIVMLQFNNIV